MRHNTRGAGSNPGQRWQNLEKGHFHLTWETRKGTFSFSGRSRLAVFINLISITGRCTQTDSFTVNVCQKQFLIINAKWIYVTHIREVSILTSLLIKMPSYSFCINNFTNLGSINLNL